VAVERSAGDEVQPPVGVEVGHVHGGGAVGVVEHGLHAELLVAVVFVPQDLAVRRRCDDVDVPERIRSTKQKMRSGSLKLLWPRMIKW